MQQTRPSSACGRAGPDAVRPGSLEETHHEGGHRKPEKTGAGTVVTQPGAAPGRTGTDAGGGKASSSPQRGQGRAASVLRLRPPEIPRQDPGLRGSVTQSQEADSSREGVLL